MRSHPLALLITIISALSKIQGISSMLAMSVQLSPIFEVCLHCNQLPYQAGWQDLKDLFRAAGNIIRADINIGADGRPKGSGTVVFETQKDAQQAISASCCLILLTDGLMML
jgi:RNA recognition motif-containing protein